MRRVIPIAVLAFAVGCGSSGPRLVPVSGIVLIDGKPLPFGVVQVAPEGGRAASGRIGPDGRFTLTTFVEGDGCYVGSHPVAVVGTESINAGSQRWHAPMKYASSAESGLTVSIDGPTSSLKIELTWAGGKPFVQHFGKE
ncbi:MAG: hypothetical protein U0746_20970 [Gemmataceae bacterium]